MNNARFKLSFDFVISSMGNKEQVVYEVDDQACGLNKRLTNLLSQ
jgi:hypothetical protein